MSIETDAISDSNPDKVERDWFLQGLVRLVDTADDDATMAITVVTGGAVLSGALIGQKQYFRLFGELYASGLTGADAEKRRQMAKAFAEGGKHALSGPEEEYMPIFLHLAKAQLVSDPNNRIPSDRTKEALWRVRLSSVDAFILGAV